MLDVDRESRSHVPQRGSYRVGYQCSIFSHDQSDKSGHGSPSVTLRTFFGNRICFALMLASPTLCQMLLSVCDALRLSNQNATLGICGGTLYISGCIYMNQPQSLLLTHSLAFGSGAAALASLFRMTLPFELPSPKKMTSTVRSSLRKVSIVQKCTTLGFNTCSAARKDLEG